MQGVRAACHLQPPCFAVQCLARFASRDFANEAYCYARTATQAIDLGIARAVEHEIGVRNMADSLVCHASYDIGI